VLEIHLIIRGALNDAERRGIVTRNVAAIAHAPKLRAIRKSRTASFALSIVILIVLIHGALGGWLVLPAAVLAHELSEFAVIANGMRMAR